VTKMSAQCSIAVVEIIRSFWKSFRISMLQVRTNVLQYLHFLDQFIEKAFLIRLSLRPELLLIHRTFDKKVAVKIIKGNAQTGGV
jgi:hypothetical protein